MPADDECRQVAAALDATPALVPYLPELLGGLWELGSSPSLIAGWLGELDLARGTDVLDLGCGKGAVSITLARDLGLRVHGVDLFEPFIRDACARAEEWGLGELCRFEKADLREVVRTAREYGVVVYASVGALGPLDECVAALRGCVRRSGYMVIDDGYLAPGAEPGPGFENLAHRDESRRRLTARGDLILREHTLGAEGMRAIDLRYIESIRSRAEALAAAYPQAADLIRGYVDRQRSAAAAWERNAVSAAWLLRKE